MAKSPARQLPLRLKIGHKTDVRAQFAALCWRVKNGKVQVCLVTSRTRKRWILPKGWPMHKHTPALSAATEAYEEAGVSGVSMDYCLGAYTYIKPLRIGHMPTIAMVYPVHVQKIHSKWPEKHQRKRKWFSAKKAAKKLTEPELKRIVSTFDPSLLPKEAKLAPLRKTPI